jgi:GNAT superfamily N-acetyltransferase
MPGLSSISVAEAPSEADPTTSPGEANYPSELERYVVSDTNTHYHVRPIRPDDGPRLVAFHRRLLPGSVFLRFFTFHPELSPNEVQHFTCVDYVNRLALVAEVDDLLIAVGRYESAPGETEAEVAFVVSDEFQHHGIGALLLDELARSAWERGITSFRSETLCENRRMLDVFRHAGFPVSSSVEYGTVNLHFPIEPTDSYRAALADREASRQWQSSQNPRAGYVRARAVSLTAR